MTQTDYEQKKRECWEEFIHSVKGITTAYEEDIAKKAISFTFDRAYALGKQTEAISQEDVEKASMKYRDAHYDKFYESLHDDSRTWDALEHVIIASFICGAQFALGKQEKDAGDDKTLKVSRQLFCRLCADADDYINEHLEEDDSDYGYYQGRSDALHELYAGECNDADAVIQGWVARSNDGPNDLGLKVYTVKPDRKKNRNGWNGHGEISYLIDCRLFPDLTWESEPLEVEIILKRKKNG